MPIARGFSLSALVVALALSACTSPGSTSPTPTSTDEVTTSTSPATSPDVTDAIAPNTITEERAAEIAMAAYNGRVLNVEAGTEDGRPTWEVELTESDQGRIEVEVDQKTGEIIDLERED